MYQDSNGRRDISFSFSSHPSFFFALSRCDPNSPQTLRDRNLAFVKRAFSKSIFARCWNHGSSISYHFRRSIDWYACFRLSHFESARNRPYHCLSIFLVSFARRSGFHFFYVNHKVVVVVLFVITHGSTGRILNLDNVLRLYFICACPLLRSPLLPFCLLSIFTRSLDFILYEKTVVARAFVLVKNPPLR